MTLALEVKNLKKNFKDFAINNISFHWKKDILWVLSVQTVQEKAQP